MDKIRINQTSMTTSNNIIYCIVKYDVKKVCFPLLKLCHLQNLLYLIIDLNHILQIQISQIS